MKRNFEGQRKLKIKVVKIEDKGKIEDYFERKIEKEFEGRINGKFKGKIEDEFDRNI